MLCREPLLPPWQCWMLALSAHFHRSGPDVCFFLDFDLCSAFPLRCLPDVVGCQNGSWLFHFSHHNEVERLVNGNLREFFEVDPSFRVMLVFGKGLSCADGGSPRPPILHPANHLFPPTCTPADPYCAFVSVIFEGVRYCIRQKLGKGDLPTQRVHTTGICRPNSTS